ncbi:Uncharacterized protein TCM_024316 [Theobroma cacao]|uniref:Reverse transcriptase Ty1/copia-type domain-containing protein n=1 Tax=Theobroma cacao TaxID=3641 RepID=A0A061EV52_THECC|nr:Uncharacterized protein TCM_024316 [Theobroma cacao]
MPSTRLRMRVNKHEIYEVFAKIILYNYIGTYKFIFLNALQSKNKAGLIDGTIVKLDVNSQDYDPWIQCNAIVLSWLTNVLAKEIQSRTTHANTTYKSSNQSRSLGGRCMIGSDQSNSNLVLAATIGDTRSSTPSPGIKAQQQQILQVLAALGVGNARSLQSASQVGATIANTTNQNDLPSRRPIGVGSVRDGLYYLEPIRKGKALMASNMRHIEMWHRRLGHLPMNRLSFVGELSVNVRESTAPSITVTIDYSVVTGKKARQIPQKLADYDFALPPSLTSSSSTYSPTPKANSTVYPLSQFISYSRFSRDHNAFLATIISTNEPTNFHQAIKHAHWRDANAKEISALEENKTWVLNDVTVTGNDPERIVKLKRYLDKKFRIKDLGKLKYFLGIEVANSPSSIVLSQQISVMICSRWVF